MLTKTDLSQIAQVVDEVVENKLQKNLKPMKKNIKVIMEFIKFYDADHSGTKKRVERIEKHLKLPPIS